MLLIAIATATATVSLFEIAYHKQRSAISRNQYPIRDQGRLIAENGYSFRTQTQGPTAIKLLKSADVDSQSDAMVGQIQSVTLGIMC